MTAAIYITSQPRIHPHRPHSQRPRPRVAGDRQSQRFAQNRPLLRERLQHLPMPVLQQFWRHLAIGDLDRKSTRLNSSH